MSLILITHDLRLAFAMCDRIYVLYAGSLVEEAPALELEREPLHPYSHGLLLSEPPADRRVRELITISGSVPRAGEVAHSCVFAPRCEWAAPQCKGAVPPLVEVAPNRWSACARLPEVRPEMMSMRKRVEQEAHQTGVIRPPNELIRSRDLVKSFRSGNRTVSALNGVSLEVREGESVGLVGESGSGKTTLSRVLMGLETASRGEVIIDGVDASDWSTLSSRDRQRLRRFVQIVFQDPYSSLNPMRTVGAVLSETLLAHNPKQRSTEQRVGELLKLVGLPTDYARRKPVALSGGERQRVAIARALAVDPRVLICDEAVSALDLSVQAQILNLFSSLRAEQGLSYLFVTHDLAVVRQVTEYVYVMHRGVVVESGATDQILSTPEHPYTARLLDSVPRSEAVWLDPSNSGAVAAPS